ncbi:hypothetical protein Tco_0249319 [Tanacetum coccineum]
MDLFRPTSVRSLNHKTYCLVITDDFSRDFIEFCGSKGIKREYIKRSTAKDAGKEPTKNPNFKQVDKEDQVFMYELERLKRQDQDANDVAEALRKEFAQETKDLLLTNRSC